MTRRRMPAPAVRFVAESERSERVESGWLDENRDRPRGGRVGRGGERARGRCDVVLGLQGGGGVGDEGPALAREVGGERRGDVGEKAVIGDEDRGRPFAGLRAVEPEGDEVVL